MKRSILTGIALVGLLSTTACQDLEIANPNQPDRNRAITQPADVESLVLGSWGLFASRTQRSGSCYNTMPLVADEATGTYANSAALELSSEPRILLNNAPSSMAQDVPRYQWYDWYLMLSNCNDALIAMNEGLDIVDDNGDRTQQTRALAKFQQGLAMGYLGMLFDKAIIATEDTDISEPSTLDPQPYTAVLAEAVKSLERAIELSAGQSWCIDNFFQERTTCATDIGPISHSFIAKFLVYGARTRAERAALPWASIVSHMDKGIDATGEDFYVMMSRGGLSSSYRYRLQNNSSFSARADYYTIGMADKTGAWQAWMATPINDRVKFPMDSSDRRVIGPGGPEDDGTYFEYRSDEVFRPERGTYHFSHYQWNRYDEEYREGPLNIISLDEMRLIRAEAALRTNNKTLAAQLINVTRVANGQLPPVTADGVPQSPDCVPKTPTGQCGSLELALYYEREIENMGLDCLRAFVSRRGFDMLTPNTFIHFAIPGDELANLGWDIYTFGGGGEGSAPGWALW